MKMEEHFKETLNRAVANEPPVLDAWDRFERRAGRTRRVRLFAGFAAAAAVAVASVIVVPKLGTDDSIKVPPQNQPSSPSPTPTVDAYAGWSTYDYALYDFTLRHPTDWRVVVFEANPEVLAPGQVPTAAGEPTMAVTLAQLTEPFDGPEWRERGFDRSTRPDGAEFIWSEENLADGGRRIEYRFEWPPRCKRQSPGPGETFVPLVCESPNETLAVTIYAGTDQLWDQYGGIAQRIVASIGYTPGKK